MPPKGSGKKAQAAAAAAAAKDNGHDEEVSNLVEEQQLLGIADGFELPRTKSTYYTSCGFKQALSND